jgi:sensor c-di-GMP phosphodiesterase-like protein
VNAYITQVDPGPGVDVLLVVHGNLLAENKTIWREVRDNDAIVAQANNRPQQVRLGGSIYTQVTSVSRDVEVIVLARNRHYLGSVHAAMLAGITGLFAAMLSASFVATFITNRNYRPLGTLLSLTESCSPPASSSALCHGWFPISARRHFRRIATGSTPS